MSQVSVLLCEQIESAEILLERAKRIPDGEVSIHVSGFLVYNKAYTRPLASDTDSWETETCEIIRALYGEESRQQSEFQSFWTPKNHYMDFRDEVQNELNRCISYLKALIKVDKMVHHESEVLPSTAIQKKPKVFISHKQEDEQYADALVPLINFILGSDGDKIFCSSIPGYGIRQSRDIIEELKSQFEQYDIFMIIIHSPRYYESAICLNEMGAAWVLGTHFCSFMTKDCDYNHMKGVINRDQICVNLNDNPEMLKAHLNEFKEDLIEFFQATAINENKWEHERDRFIRAASSIQLTITDQLATKEKVVSGNPEQQGHDMNFSNPEIEILLKWVNSPSAEAHKVLTKDGTSFIVGGVEYNISSARERIEWDDFFDRMTNSGLIERVRTNRWGETVYQLKKPAIDFIALVSRDR